MRNINADVLMQAINEHKDEKFQKDFREWLVFTAPPEVQAIFKSYVEKMEEQEARQRLHMKHTGYLVTGLMVALIVYTIYHLMTSMPICR